MTLLSSSELASALGVSKGRVSQYVSEDKLGGCFTGEGRLRRFDLGKVCTALGRQLDRGQMMGNGSGTRRAIEALRRPDPTPLPFAEADDDDLPVAPAPAQRDGTLLTGKDPDRYELARTQKAEEETRRLRRINAEAEGTYVLAAEVERQVARLLAQEIAEFEAVLRDGSRRVADKLGVDFKAVRQLMLDQWRGHRATRSQVLDAQARDIAATGEETEGDI